MLLQRDVDDEYLTLKNVMGKATVSFGGNMSDPAAPKSFLETYGLTGTATVDRSKLGDDVALALQGVDHTARPTWKLRETVEFYRDVLGLRIVHCIAAKGWGPPGHPDFLHFFFESGRGSTIAFFYYIGTTRPDYLEPQHNYMYAATHTAWRVDSREELILWKETLERRGVAVSPYTRHELIESIYFNDPNGYPVEVTLALRETEPLDGEDSSRTLEAAMALETELRAQGAEIEDIGAIYRRKAAIMDAAFAEGSA
jgi:catechol 2,3-dioxygenase-like lactoylglutathione lyase family enzyme